MSPQGFFDAIEMLAGEGQERLLSYATGNHRDPLPGFWTAVELVR
ncbi:MAG: hypothetical protein ACRDK3_00600 [Actinomycetota bacterium]